jgi:PrgI family protein
MRPPTRIDTSERRFFGWTYRQLVILASSGVAALASLIGLKSWPLWLRIVLMLACACLGLVWAFWQSHGQTLEEHLLARLIFQRRTRHLLHRAAREAEQGRATFPANESPVAAVPRLRRQPAALAWQPGLFWITANALGISILTGLTLWLMQGGAHQLELLWRIL